MATFVDKLKKESRLYLDSLKQQDETLQMDLRNFLVDSRKQLMVVQSIISYQTVKDILRNFPNLSTKVKSEYGDPTCLTWEQYREAVKTSKMVVTLPKLLILDYNKSDFDYDDSKLLKTLLGSYSCHLSAIIKIVIVLPTETKDLKHNFESFLGGTYFKLEYSMKNIDLKQRDEVQKANSLLEAASLGNYYQVMRFIDDNADINMKNQNCNTALHKAAEKGYKEIVLFLLQQGAAQLPNNAGCYPLHIACRYGHNDIVPILIEYGAYLERESYVELRPLHYASNYNHANIVETLLQYGAEVDGLNSSRETSLHVAVRRNSLEAVKILIENGANPKLLNNQNQTAAQVALAEGFKHIADYLDEKLKKKQFKIFNNFKRNNLWQKTYMHTNMYSSSLSFNMIQNTNLQNPQIIMATFSDKLKKESRLYLDSLKQQDETLQMDVRNFLVDSRKQLMVVQSVISYQTVKDILKNFPNLGTKVKSEYGDPMCLTWEQCRKVVKTSKMILTLPKLLILDFNKLDFDSDDLKLLKTLLNHDSVLSKTTIKIIVVLSAETNDLKNNFESSLGGTYVKLEYSEKKIVLKDRDEVQNANSLLEAASLGNYYQVMRFIDHNADINMKNQNYDTALHKAAEKGHKEIVLFLLDNGANQLINGSKKNPLHFACRNGHNDIVPILIEYGAKLEQEDSDGYTSLTYASINLHRNVVETLLQYGAEVDGLNSRKETSLHVAALTDSLEAVKILIENGANPKLLNKQKQTVAQVALAKGFNHIADYLNDEKLQKKETEKSTQ
ncbi:putative ankyrin repeat protein RF_0381 [Euwallacea similis]|uniref:putative ankyrin repeat protein RF_0381 n=1 Tax=Euwallacea similis TaxID=1736056 RepID=UPI00344B564D